MTVNHETGVPFLELLDPAFRPDSPEVKAARESCWYASTPLGLAVLRYQEAAALLRDRRLRQGTSETLALQGVLEGPLAEWWRVIILNLEGDTHRRLRRLVTKAFSQGNIEALRPAMRANAHELIDAFAGRGECDFMEAFADRYPVRIICELLGVPKEERDDFQGWADDIGLAFSFTVPQYLDCIEAALQGLYARTDVLLAERRRQPKDDLVTALIAAEEAGDRLSDEELRTMVSGLVFAGHDTTRNQLGYAMATFIDHPEQWALLAQDPSLAAKAVEEVMRVAPTVPIIARTATEDFEFQGLRIPSGTFLSILAASAHTDPRVFAESFDIRRELPAPQLSFGGGVHYCLGAWMARAELAEALPILAERLLEPRLAGKVSWRPFLGICGPTRLPIRFRTAQ
jgi:cytochrome P450